MQGTRVRRRGRKADAATLDQDRLAQEEQFAPVSPDGNTVAHGGRGGGVSGAVSRPSKDVVHHHPPKEIAKDVGYPVRGGQTLLIAYFPWEASEADIEREFSKLCRVKRVHLVVDKSSRKPRCFGFVKFMTKVDAEEALQATTKGLVQLPDTRGHVWHLKAEWTKSGDMVVDDSETEQEVVKRKEERRSRAEQRGTVGPMSILDMPDSVLSQPKSGRWPAAAGKGALHPGVPAPLPPLQPRCQQGQMPALQPGHTAGGASARASHLAPQAQVQHMLPAHQSLTPNQHLAQQVFHGQQGQHMYSGTSSSPTVYGTVGGGTAQQLGRDSSVSMQSLSQGIHHPAGTLPQDSLGLAGAAQPVLRDHLAASQGYNAPPQAYAATQQSYAAAQQGYAPPAHGYAQQPQGYVAAQQGQQTYVTNQHSFATAHQGYAPQQSGYAPQAHAYASQQQGASYGSTAAGYSAQAYAGYNMGHSIQQQGGYGFMQQANAAPAPSGVVAYGGYPAGPSAGAPAHHQVLVHQGDDPSQESAPLAIAGMPHVVVSPAAQSSYMPTTQLAQSQVQCGCGTAVAAGSAPPQRAMGDMAAVPSAAAGVATPPGAVASHSAAASGADAQYSDMMWRLSEMSLHDKAAIAVQQLPAPPAQQPPAPPTRRNVIEVMQHFSAVHGLPGGAGPSSVWNSFDDAAAKGMVDGLVGREDGAAPFVAAWNPHLV